VSRELEKLICNWRVTRGVPSGMHIWFDPNVESVKLFRVPTREQQPLLRDGGSLDAGVGPGYLDKVVSVSASGPDRTSLESDSTNNDPQIDLSEDLPF